MTPTRRFHVARHGIGFPRARFVTVLVLLLLLLVVEVGVGLRRTSPILMGLWSSVILVVAIVTATEDRRSRRTGLTLAALAIVSNATSLLGYHPWGLSPDSAMSAVFAGYATLRLFIGVVRSRRVTGDVLAGALAAYVLAGMSFALVYSFIDNRWPGSFATADGQPAAIPDLLYFSFVTLLTIGFGDVVPHTGAVRAVTLLEGLFGVVYTTVVMAALVAGYLGQNANRVRDDDVAPPASDGP
jgi:voltage-gated potassium channel